MNITKISNNAYSNPVFAARLQIDKTNKDTQQEMEYAYYHQGEYMDEVLDTFTKVYPRTTLNVRYQGNSDNGRVYTFENTTTHKRLSTEQHPVNSFPEALEYVMTRKDIMECPSILDHKVFIIG
ncbi:MAG: hypothetical protein NC191_03725 [Muribaculaceae bacterium]|nr:hypothetical protein [Muribaculaceae bacterium]